MINTKYVLSAALLISALSVSSLSYCMEENRSSGQGKQEESVTNSLQQQKPDQVQQEQDRNQQKELQRSGSRQPSQQSMPTQGRQGQDQQQLSGSSNGGTFPGYEWLLENAKHTYNDHATAFNRGGVGIAVIGVAAIAFMGGKKLKLW